MAGGMKLMSDPRVGKLMSNPKVMRVAMQAFTLPGRAQATVSAKVRAIAKAFDLATKEEVQELKSAVRTLEQKLREQAKGSGAGHSNGSRSAVE